MPSFVISLPKHPIQRHPDNMQFIIHNPVFSTQRQLNTKKCHVNRLQPPGLILELSLSIHLGNWISTYLVQHSTVSTLSSFPLLTLMWIVPFWSLSLSFLPKLPNVTKKPNRESMLTEILNIFFFCSVILISVYLVRHYIFTLTVLRNAKKPATIRKHLLSVHTNLQFQF